ncbi:butyrophilin-like protein 10 isoform X3 [Oryctolagus cuniculus]|uniref:butyrophilin-like protein 10 isoform X3 n=1 Tax=Oryctolagus cuniculus TaxID=9986 RepID=UPI003879CF35
MELRWYRSRPLPTMYLHRRRAQVSREQMAESRGRTTFLGNHLARGKAVLGIHNITVYDNGTYPCLFRDGEPHSETTLALQVAGLGLEPRIHVTEDLDKGIRAECTSAGWYPEPHVEWRDFRGHAVPAVTRFSASATTGLLAVLSRVAVPDRSMGGLTCSISSPLLHERKVAESHLPVSPSLDPATASPRLSLSEDQKSMRRLLFDQDLPPCASSFNQDPCVLAWSSSLPGSTTGRSRWGTGRPGHWACVWAVWAGRAGSPRPPSMASGQWSIMRSDSRPCAIPERGSGLPGASVRWAFSWIVMGDFLLKNISLLDRQRDIDRENKLPSDLSLLK